MITIGEYSGIKGVAMYTKNLRLNLILKKRVKNIRTCRYANVHTQKPLVADELRYCKISRNSQLMIVTP